MRRNDEHRGAEGSARQQLRQLRQLGGDANSGTETGATGISDEAIGRRDKESSGQVAAEIARHAASAVTEALSEEMGRQSAMLPMVGKTASLLVMEGAVHYLHTFMQAELGWDRHDARSVEAMMRMRTHFAAVIDQVWGAATPCVDPPAQAGWRWRQASGCEKRAEKVPNLPQVGEQGMGQSESERAVAAGAMDCGRQRIDEHGREEQSQAQQKLRLSGGGEDGAAG
eukprot:1934667-Prymnesium_polylepis.1